MSDINFYCCRCESNVSVYEDNLNGYWERMDKHLSELKDKGYRIYRNPDGKHKVVRR